MAEFSRRTKDVNILTGDPKKAIVAMIVPITIALVIQTLNNMIDSVWVAGLGSTALAAVGVVFPIFFILVAIGNGIGIGASQAIARRIGAKDTEGADKAAVQGVMLTIAAGVIMTVVLFIAAPYILAAIGGADYLDECLAYAYPVILGCIVFFMSGYLTNLLRSEGAAKRSMNIQILAAAINIVLDPIFIYIFGWGLMGAAVATLLAMFISLLICVYWYKIKKDTYLKLSFSGFRFDRVICKDIFSVGLPAAMEMLLISVTSMIMNIIVVGVGGTDGVAIFTSAWRIINMLMIPMMAVSQAMVPVCAVSYGARRVDRIDTAYKYAVKLILLVMIAITAVTLIFAPQICVMFTYSDNTAGLRDGMVEMLRIMVLALPLMGLGFVSSGFFQALGMGMKSLISTLFRNLLQIPICIYLATFGILSYIWVGAATAEIFGSVVMGFWGFLLLKYMLREWKSHGGSPAE